MSKGIKCPKCEKIVMVYDDKGTTNLSCKCNVCNLLVIYHPKENVCTLKKVPERKDSSGKRFY